MAEATDSVSDDCEDPLDDEVEVDAAVPDGEVSLPAEAMEAPAVAVAGTVESIPEETPPAVLLPAPSLGSLEAEAVVELAKSGRAVAEAITDEEVVGGRTVVKLDVVSMSTQSRS